MCVRVCMCVRVELIEQLIIIIKLAFFLFYPQESQYLLHYVANVV